MLLLCRPSPRQRGGLAGFASLSLQPTADGRAENTASPLLFFNHLFYIFLPTCFLKVGAEEKVA